MINLEGIENIILDLGGVILELDTGKTIEKFIELGFPPLENEDIILSKYPFFLEFETGMLSIEEFIARLVGISGNHAPEEKILEAWNAMILGFRPESIRLLHRLKKKYRLFLLSNTNAIHEVYYNSQLKKEHGIGNLDRIFEKVYYSHELKMRKPDPEIFRHVLEDMGQSPGKCLFIDDTLVNIDSARRLGIRAYHLAPPERLTDIL